ALDLTSLNVEKRAAISRPAQQRAGQMILEELDRRAARRRRKDDARLAGRPIIMLVSQPLAIGRESERSAARLYPQRWISPLQGHAPYLPTVPHRPLKDHPLTIGRANRH